MSFKKKIGPIAMFVESSLLPLVFLWLMLNNIKWLYQYSPVFWGMLSQLSQSLHQSRHLIALAAYVSEFLRLFFHGFIIWGLLVRRNLYREPESLREIFIPLLATFFYLLYGFVKYIPENLNPFLLPKNVLPFTLLIGAVINIIGIIISCAATYQLRFSFSVFVEVRDIVSKGLYRFVRHPIYFGYVITFTGFLLIIPRLGEFLLYMALVSVTLYRAYLEERKLIASSDDYRVYARRTPFILPFSE